jgi:hypothetical protein
MFRTPRNAIYKALISMGFLVLVCAMVACSATRGRRKGEVPQSGFLRDYSQLEKLEDWPAREAYFNPNAQWSRYDSIHIDSVTLWGTDESIDKLSAEDRQMLTDTLYTALHEELGQYFNLSDHPGTNTISLRAALTQGKGAKAVMRGITSIHPGTLLLGAAVGLSLDTANSVGSATMEAELLDSATNERLAAVVDQRAGTKVFFLIAPKRTFTKWGDIKAIGSYWAKRAAIVMLTKGVPAKEGAPPPPKN